MLDQELNEYRQKAGDAAPVLGALISVTAAILSRPIWMVAGIVVLFFIGASQHVHDIILLPIGLALVVWGVILRLQGR
jgi:hypothetical protein